MIEQVRAICMEWIIWDMHFVCEKKIPVNKFFNLGSFISFVS